MYLFWMMHNYVHVAILYERYAAILYVRCFLLFAIIDISVIPYA